MKYLNRDLSIQGLHAELDSVRTNNIWCVSIFEVKGQVYQIEPCSVGLCLIDDLGQTVATSRLSDFDFSDNNTQALFNLLSDLYDQVTNGC